MIIFFVGFDHFWHELCFFVSAGAVGKFDSGLNQNNIYKFSLSKSMEHTVPLLSQI